MNNKALRLGSAAVIAAAGMYLLIVLLNSMRPVIASGFFLIPGRFLYLCFMEAAFYLPLLFLISSFLLIADYYNSRIFTAKLLSLLPFFTFSLLLRILNYFPGSPAADFFIRNLGIRGGSMVLGLLLIPEILIIARVLLGRNSRPEPVSSSMAYAPSAPAAVVSGGELPPDDDDSTETDNVPEHLYDPVPLQWNEEAVEIIQGAEEPLPGEVEQIEPEDGEPEDGEPEDGEPEELGLEEIEPEIEEIYFMDDTADEEFENEPDVDPFEFDDEQIIEPLDLDPDAGRITGHAEPQHTMPLNDENYPDAPVRGDEEDLTQAAREVWADAEQLGFDDVLPEYVSEESPGELPDEEQTVEAEDEEISLDIASGIPSLEIPDVSDMTTEPSIETVVEVFEELGRDDDIEEFEDAEAESIVDIDLVLTPEKGIVADNEVEVSDRSEAADKPAVLPALNLIKKRRHGKYSVPVEDLLEHYEDNSYWIVDDDTKAAAEILRETLEEFRIAAEVTGISKGPVITMFEILPAPGVKLSKIVNLADNIALRLAASRVRIVAPIPGKHAVGIEVPNKNRAIVSFKEILEAEDLKKSRMMIPVVLGKDITGGARIIDLVQTPHLLIAGATGSGKSVSVNSLICSILYSRTPDEVKMILIDPKIVELKMYNDIPHLLTPVITEPKRAFQALQYAMCEMERRYSLLNALGVRDIKSYNRKVKDLRLATDELPYIVIIVDEFADLMATTGKELENVISRLAAMSRAVGIHLVLATQRPSVDVITGLIKANIPSRIAFMVASKTDSRIILDTMGADKLLGKGDMLFTSAWDPNPVRIQGAFLSDDEVERVTDHVKTLGEPEYIDDEIFMSEDDNGDFELESSGSGDPLMDTAVSIVVEAGKASASYLQRRLKIGYNRAARLVEEMEERGIVGPANGSKPREIIHIPDRV